MLDRIGRRLSVALFAIGCVVVTIAYLLLPIGGTAMLLLGFPLGFCAAGIPASMGALFNELYPAGVRGTGVGFCYNFGRILAAGLPVLIGYMSGEDRRLAPRSASTRPWPTRWCWSRCCCCRRRAARRWRGRNGSRRDAAVAAARG